MSTAKAKAYASLRQQWIATMPGAKREHAMVVEKLRAAMPTASAPDLDRCRKAIEIHDSLKPRDWDQAWDFAVLEPDTAIEWLIAGWWEASSVACAHRRGLTPQTATERLLALGLTPDDVLTWHVWVEMDFPWDDFNAEAVALLDHVRASRP